MQFLILNHATTPLTRLALRAIHVALCMLLQPWVIQDLLYIQSLADVSIQHFTDKIYALFAQNVWNTQIVIHNLVNAVEWVLLIYDRVQQDTESPNILLFAVIRLAG